MIFIEKKLDIKILDIKELEINKENDIKQKSMHFCKWINIIMFLNTSIFYAFWLVKISSNQYDYLRLDLKKLKKYYNYLSNKVVLFENLNFIFL